MRLADPRGLLIGAFAALSATLLAGAAMAQVTSEQQSAIRSNCRSDFMSKCSGVQPGGKEALACLQQHVATLSAACKTAVSATIPAPAPAAKAEPATEPPAAKTEPPAEPKSADAPPPAKPAIVTAPPPAAKPPRPPAATAAPAAAGPSKATQDALRQRCRADAATHCQGMAGPIILECLQRNVGALTPPCREAVAGTMPRPAPGAVVVAPPPPPPVVVVEPPRAGPPPGSALVAKACAREIIMHCRRIEPGGGRIVGCLKARVASGVFVAPRCRAVLKVTSELY